MRVTVTGTGYVGTVTGACLAYLGHRVTCVDNDAQKIAVLQQGGMSIYEPHLQELVKIVTKSGALDFTTEIEAAVAESDVIFIAVGTPPRPSGEANLTFLEVVARSIGASMDCTLFRVVVNKSTVPVGSGNLVGTLIREGIIESRPGQEKRIAFAVASNLEFLREGCALADSLYPDRIVIGTEEEQSMNLLRELYKPLITQEFTAPEFLPRPKDMTRVPLVTTTLTSAEMIKYASNAFLATKIGFANEVANICERVCADSSEVKVGLVIQSCN